MNFHHTTFLHLFANQNSTQTIWDLIRADAPQIMLRFPRESPYKNVIPAVKIGFILYPAHLLSILNEARSDWLLEKTELHAVSDCAHLGNHGHLEVPTQFTMLIYNADSAVVTLSETDWRQGTVLYCDGTYALGVSELLDHRGEVWKLLGHWGADITDCWVFLRSQLLSVQESLNVMKINRVFYFLMKECFTCRCEADVEPARQ